MELLKSTVPLYHYIQWLCGLCQALRIPGDGSLHPEIASERKVQECESSQRRQRIVLKREPGRKLEHAGKAVWADFLQGAKIPRTRVGHQVASLLQGCTVTAVGPDWVVLQLVDPVAILHVVVGVVEQIERLRLQLQHFAFPERKTAGQPNVNPLQPRAVERIQSNSRRRASAIDAPRGVCGVLVEGGVVQVVISAVTVAEGESRTGA